MRQRTTLPMVLDECITDVHSLLRAYEAKAMEAFNLKISKVGGLTKAKLMRDLAVALGLRVTIEDTWGGDIVTAAVSHLAASTPADSAVHGLVHERLDERAHRGPPAALAATGSARRRPAPGSASRSTWRRSARRSSRRDAAASRSRARVAASLVLAAPALAAPPFSASVRPIPTAMRATMTPDELACRAARSRSTTCGSSRWPTSASTARPIAGR